MSAHLLHIYISLCCLHQLEIHNTVPVSGFVILSDIHEVRQLNDAGIKL